MDIRLYMAQRLSALVMAPLVLGHIAVMIYAVQSGITTAEILGRTQGSILWFLFYGTFVLAVSVHAAVGVRVILNEWLGIKGNTLNLLSWAIGIGLLLLGGRAVLAVTFL
ncbi:succinate dehydrogenase [Ahrensia marina]|uniref:Succinate dehydrogenase n=1 Tax=Ahrensia marina TaxID=1514904 RepID=A0A0M9GLS7_9HYPH|nr:succinate dehydrogenase [Ahrensia marina]KPB00439.1 succinate dehydrogenase [Ahrensia marina]